MKPRLRHVAEVAGVSQATVSRVLNGKAGVAETTRRSVLRALTDLGYEPVGVGRTRRTGLVGLIVPELDNPVFPRLAQALESRLAAQGQTTVLCTSTPAGVQEEAYLDVLLDHAVTGIVLVSGEHSDREADHGRYHDLVARGVPTVVVNGRAPGLELPSVTVDHVAAARQAVGHLAALGHRRIGLAIGPRRYVHTEELLTGYREGLDAAGLPRDDGLVAEALYGIEGGHASGDRLLGVGATAVACASDLVALGVVRAARDRGAEVPRDVSVVGFDDAGPNAYVDPALTSVRQPFDAMADAVVRLLTDRVADPASPPTELRFRPELVVRASTDAAPR
ncbi:LacI family DNA-binding transcriptional regulator [Nitriliruptoraceae bacterium ZYF776]|nr:LacI family DNA-binding transcriptional regulator [Profundirhabdus halotolerans]